MTWWLVLIHSVLLATWLSTPCVARTERALPAFTGKSLQGETLSLSDAIGKRLLLVLFDADAKAGQALVRAVANIENERSNYNFDIFGITRTSPEAFQLVERGEINFPVIQDADGKYFERVGVKSGAGLVLVDSQGYIVRGAGGLPDGPSEEEASKYIEQMAREWLRLPVKEQAKPILGVFPNAPEFRAESLDGTQSFELSSVRGKPVILMFFLHTCPHCHEALRFFKTELEKMPDVDRPVFVGISIQSRTKQVRESLKADGLDFFPVYIDSKRKIQNAYGGLTGVPTTFLINQEGQIVSRTDGWRRHREPPLMTMRLAKLANQPIPMLLNRRGFSGTEFCLTCHQDQHDTWELTTHATAFATLVQHGADREVECVGCHVVGYKEKGGFSLTNESRHLENVGCESCHGRGGPHLSPNFVKNNDYASICLDCHDSKHSLGFEYSVFLPKVSHAENLHFSSLSVNEKQELLNARREIRKALLPEDIDFVGSDACVGCHASEHEIWSKHAHAQSGKTLIDSKQGSNDSCLDCHTTGYGKPGGFPIGEQLPSHQDLAVVGCESCHGPGGDHIKMDSSKRATILSLEDKCDSCVILQICGGCHDNENDPGFEFNVQKKIDLQRHGSVRSNQ